VDFGFWYIDLDFIPMLATSDMEEESGPVSHLCLRDILVKAPVPFVHIPK
jgi:hypothetical protein